MRYNIQKILVAAGEIACEKEVIANLEVRLRAIEAKKMNFAPEEITQVSKATLLEALSDLGTQCVKLVFNSVISEFSRLGYAPEPELQLA